MNFFTKVGNEYKDLPLPGVVSNYTLDLCEVSSGKSSDFFANIAISNNL